MRFCYFSLQIKADVRLLLCMVSTVTYSTSPHQRFLQDSGCCWSQIDALIPNFSLPGEMLQTLPSLPLATLEYTFENEAVTTIFMNGLGFLAFSKSCWEHTSVWLNFPFGTTFFQSSSVNCLECKVPSGITGMSLGAAGASGKVDIECLVGVFFVCFKSHFRLVLNRASPWVNTPFSCLSTTLYWRQG